MKNIGVFLLLAGLIVGCNATEQRSNLGPKSPHVFIIMADDLGIDVGPCHSDVIYMPKLESRCSKSLVFNKAYAYPYCSATRASLLTGRHSFRHGVNDVRQSVKKLPLAELTLPEWISEIAPDYRSAAFGKWHLADDENGGINNPNLQGFDHYEGTPRQAGTYNYFEYEWFINGASQGIETSYKTTKITNSVVDDFKDNHESPQFYYINYVNPHLPYHTPPTELHNVSLLDDPAPKPSPEHLRDERLDPYYFAMLEALDTEINRLVHQSTSMSERPIVFIFLGDNGSAQNVYRGDISGGYRAKASLYDGGIRIPMQIWSSDNAAYPIVRGRTNIFTHTVDLYSTISDIVHPGGGDVFLNPVDSKTFKPVFNDLEYSKREYLYIESGHPRRLPFSYSAINASGMKLILNERERPPFYISDVYLEYYDTENDLGETYNLLDKPCDVDFSEVNKLIDYLIKTRESEDDPIGADFDKTWYLQSLHDLQSQC